MGKNTARAETARKAAELRAAAARKERQQKQLITAAVAVVVVIIAVAIGLVVASQPKQAEPAASSGASAALTKLTSLPLTTLEKAPKPTAQQMPAKLPGGTAITGENGKAKVIYVGAEYCPFCAMERWPLIAALSQFGTFEGLTPTTSSSSDVHPDTVTWSFTKSTYTSDFVDFQAVETRDREGKPLENLEGQPAELFQKFNPGGGIPWITFGGTHAISAATVDTSVFDANNSYDKIIAGVQDPSSAIGQGIDPSITAMTAQICSLTDNKPEKVCASPAIVAAAAQVQR